MIRFPLGIHADLPVEGLAVVPAEFRVLYIFCLIRKLEFSLAGLSVRYGAVQGGI